MAERNLPTGLKNSLIDGDPYSYFHLVKFEKPRPTAASGETSGKATDYAYITDSSINILFNDGSVDSRGVLNQEQTYVANKLINVGTVSETTEAKASSISLTLSGTALGTIVIANTTFTSTTMTADIDLLEAGFQEGDTILLESAGAVNNNKYVRIDTFTNNNQTVSLTPYNTTITTEPAGTEYTLSYASEEVSSLIINKTGATNYSSYINREAFIYRAHMDPETGVIIGAPFLIFRGIIAKGAVSDNMLTTSKVTWSLTSHWGDFVRVQGRQTSDSQHRALSITGEPDIDALIRPEYAQDPGFVHAESSVNVMATYQTLEKKFRMRKRGGFAGLFGGTKMLEYTEIVDKEIDLQFNLEAKYLPVVYGVQKVDSFPVFADIKAQTPGSASPTEVYIAHAICEGEISGILDIHIDDTTLICLDASDSDVRAGGGENVSTVCFGRADRGDVLSGGTMYGAVIEIGDVLGSGELQNGGYHGDQNVFGKPLYEINIGSQPNSFGGTGLRHEDTIRLQSPLETNLFIHTGKPDQTANNTLVNLSRSNSFKIQQDYYSGVLADYWSTSHRLLDTAYVVGKYTINEGETTIPKLEFVVKGSSLECYNYDYSYLANDIQVDGTPEDFLLGDLVTLHHTVGDAQIGFSSITIIDKWSYYDQNGNLSYRFRFSDNPQTVTPVSNFYMKNAAGTRKWYMSTYDALDIDKVAIPAQPSYEVASAALNTSGTHLNLFLATSINIAGMPYGTPVVVTFPELLPTASFIMIGTFSGIDNKLPTVNEGAASEAIIANISKGLTPTVTISDRITLGPGSSIVDDFYNNKVLTLTRYIDDVITQEVTRKIIGYDGTTKIALLESGLPPSFLPDSVTDVISISSLGDKRVPINPAIQLLDYLTSTRYGKGLKSTDLNLNTFLESARYCDTRSDVIVQVAGSTIVPENTVYKYEADGVLIFQGKVKNNSISNSVNIAGTPTIFQEVTFTDVIGKLAYKWNNWKAFPVDYPIWNNGVVYLGTGSVVDSVTALTNPQSSLSLTRVSGTGAASLPLSITEGFTSSGNPIIKKFTNSLEGFNSPGYSLYDSDDVKYWAYLGWDEPTQRSVTRHQTNQVINTSSPLFDNINSMLLQFNGIMRYSNGKYELDIKRAAPVNFESFQVITEEDIFGELKVSDKGQKNTYNSMETTIIDPQNKFSGRGIKFFNSTYLKEDKGIRRAGNFAMPGISNYYNARLNIKQYLDTSRFGLDIDFTIDSKGYLLLAGTIIKLSYARFGWVDKLFRIENLNFNINGLVQVSASEHNDEAFLIGNIQGSKASQVEEASGGAVNQDALPSPLPPTNLQATTGGKGGITVTWSNSANFKESTHSTQVYASSIVNDRVQSSLIAVTKATTITDIVTAQVLTNKYYWVRHVATTNDNKQLVSDYFPLSDIAGILGSATGAIDGARGFDSVTVSLTSDDYSIVYDENGLNPVPTSVTLTATAQNVENAFFKFNINGVQEPGFTDGTTALSDTRSVTIPVSYFDVPINILVAVSDGDQVELAFDTISLFAVKPGISGIDGTDAITAVMSNEAHVLSTTSSGVVDYAGSGTIIELYEGATALNYDGIGTAPGTWKFTHTSINISISDTITDSGTYVTIGNHKDMIAVNGSISYVITGKRLDGVTDVSLTKTQSFSKSIEGYSPVFGVDYFNGADGDPGETGPRTATGFVYYQVASASPPTTPTATSYSFSAGAFTGLSGNWLTSAPVFQAGNANKYWYSSYTVAETVFEGAQTLQFSISLQGIGFSGLVTFTGDNLTDGTTAYDPAVVVNAGVTTINGGKITADSIDAAQLKISSDTSSPSSMFFDGTNNRIDIKDSGGFLRVRIGNLIP